MKITTALTALFTLAATVAGADETDDLLREGINMLKVQSHQTYEFTLATAQVGQTMVEAMHTAQRLAENLAALCAVHPDDCSASMLQDTEVVGEMAMAMSDHFFHLADLSNAITEYEAVLSDYTGRVLTFVNSISP